MNNYFSFENLWVFIATAILSLVFWCFNPYKYIPIWIAAILFFLCLMFLWLALLFRTKTAEVTEKELFALVPAGITTINEDTILLIKPNKLLFMGAFVTIHQKNNDVEVYVGTGKVTNIQTNGMVQITLFPPCSITTKDIPSLIPKLGFSVNALKDNPEHYHQ